jgi:UPF0755 protein
MFKIAFRLFLIVLIIVLFVAGGAYFWYQDAVFGAVSLGEDQVQVTAEEGDTPITFANKLYTAGVLKNTEAWRIYLRLGSPELNLQAGNYFFAGDVNYPQIIEVINAGPKLIAITVAIPEGLRIDEQAKIIGDKFTESAAEAKDGIAFSASEYLTIAEQPDRYTFSADLQQFLDLHKPASVSLEGYLFPDTYTIGLDATAMQVIELQLNTLLAKLEGAGIDPNRAGDFNFHQIVTLASIVHRECFYLADKQLVADVFIRRIQEGWSLGSDVTVLYPYKRWTPEPTYEELQAYTPYNTRLITGLPPTPISGVGIEDIQAVYNPTPNNYYYFISVGSDMYYAATLQEHNYNVNTYLR